MAGLCSAQEAVGAAVASLYYQEARAFWEVSEINLCQMGFSIMEIEAPEG